MIWSWMGLSSAVDLARALRILMKESLSGLCTTFSLCICKNASKAVLICTLLLSISWNHSRKHISLYQAFCHTSTLVIHSDNKFRKNIPDRKIWAALMWTGTWFLFCRALGLAIAIQEHEVPRPCQALHLLVSWHHRNRSYTAICSDHCGLGEHISCWHFVKHITCMYLQISAFVIHVPHKGGQKLLLG